MAGKAKTSVVRKAKKSPEEKAATKTGATEIVKTEALARVEETKEMIAEQLGPFGGLLQVKKIRKQEDVDRVAVALRVTTKLIKDAEKAKKEITGPLWAAKKAVDKQFKTATAGIQKVNDHCRDLDAEWRAHQKALTEKKAEKQAAKFEKEGALQLAEDIRREAAEFKPDNVHGITSRTYVRARVLDMAKLIHAVHSGKLPSTIFKIDQSALNQWAKLNRQHEKGEYGLEVYEEESTVVL